MFIDKAIEDAVHDYLVDLNVKGRLLAEEHGAIRQFGTEEISEGEELVVIFDPIDGSENLKRNIPLYSSALALGFKSAISSVVTFENLLVGAIIDFGMDTIIEGIMGKEIIIKGKNTRFYDLSIPIRSTNITTCGYFRTCNSQVVMDSLKKALKSFSLRNLGSVALELLYAALHKFDLFFDFRNRLNVYDIAASCVILKETGARVVIYPEQKYETVPLDLNRKYSLMASHNLNLMEAVEEALGGMQGMQFLLS